MPERTGLFLTFPCDFDWLLNSDHQPDLDSTEQVAATTADAGSRASLYAQCAALLAEDPAWLCLYMHTKLSGCSCTATITSSDGEALLQRCTRPDGILDARAALI